MVNISTEIVVFVHGIQRVRSVRNTCRTRVLYVPGLQAVALSGNFISPVFFETIQYNRHATACTLLMSRSNEYIIIIYTNRRKRDGVVGTVTYIAGSTHFAPKPKIIREPTRDGGRR